MQHDDNNVERKPQTGRWDRVNCGLNHIRVTSNSESMLVSLGKMALKD